VVLFGSVVHLVGEVCSVDCVAVAEGKVLDGVHLVGLAVFLIRSVVRHQA
jgi:hypothetical protein